MVQVIPREKRPGCHNCLLRKLMICTGPKHYKLRTSSNGHIQRLEPVRQEWQSKCMYLVEEEARFTPTCVGTFA